MQAEHQRTRPDDAPPGPVALVTGASGDLGSAIATALAEAGMAVVLHANKRRTRVEEIAHRISSTGGIAAVVEGDLAEAATAMSVVDDAAAVYGSLDVLVNNAGGSRTVEGGDGFLMMQTAGHIDTVLDINLAAAIHCSRQALRHLMRRRRGAIVNIGSLSGQTGVSGQVAYSAAKAGLAGLTRSLALEMGPKGIRVNAVAPGFIESDVVAAMPDNAIRLEAIALRRLGLPREVAAAVAFLASDQASYVTGTVMNVNGGLYTGPA